jgi:hypothetical protein
MVSRSLAEGADVKGGNKMEAVLVLLATFARVAIEPINLAMIGVAVWLGYRGQPRWSPLALAALMLVVTIILAGTAVGGAHAGTPLIGAILVMLAYAGFCIGRILLPPR